MSSSSSSSIIDHINFGENHEDSFTTFSMHVTNVTTTTTSGTMTPIDEQLKQWIQSHPHIYTRAPLSYPKPSKEDHDRLSQEFITIDRRELKLDQPLVKLAIDLSQELHLNELLVVKLIYQSIQEMRSLNIRRETSTVKKRCIELYQQERYEWCLSLLSLLLEGRKRREHVHDEQKMITSSEEESTEDFLVQTCAMFASNEFITKITQQMMDMMTMGGSTVTTTDSVTWIELSLLSQILLFAVDALLATLTDTRTVVVEQSTVKNIAQVIRQLLKYFDDAESSSLSSSTLGATQKVQLRIIYTLALAFSLTLRQNDLAQIFNQEMSALKSVVDSKQSKTGVHKNLYRFFKLIDIIHKRRGGDGQAFKEVNAGDYSIFSQIETQILPLLTTKTEIDSWTLLMDPSNRITEQVNHFMFESFSLIVLQMFHDCSGQLAKFLKNEADEFKKQRSVQSPEDDNKFETEGIVFYLVSLFSLIGYLARHSPHVMMEGLRDEHFFEFITVRFYGLIISLDPYHKFAKMNYLLMLHILCNVTKDGYSIVLKPILDNEPQVGCVNLHRLVDQMTHDVEQGDFDVTNATLALVEDIVRESGDADPYRNNKKIVPFLAGIMAEINGIPSDLSRSEFMFCGQVFSLLGALYAKKPNENERRLIEILQFIWEGGCEFHFREMEAKSYDISLGVLDLFNRLVRRGIDRGQLAPIIDLNFVKNVVFARHHTLTYSEETNYQKWLLAQKSLEIMDMITQYYNPTRDDTSANSMGFDLFCDLLSERATYANSIVSVLVSMIETASMITKEEERNKLNVEDQRLQFTTEFAYVSIIENCIIYALAVIQRVLQKQRIFADIVSQNQVIVLTPLDKYLILHPNFVMTITKFMDYQYNIEVRKVAASVLLSLSCSQPEKLTIHLSNSSQVMDIFVKGLVGTIDRSNTDYAIRSTIIELLKSNVTSYCPDLSHWLCGFNTPNITGGSAQFNCLDVICDSVKQSFDALSWTPDRNHDTFIAQCVDLIKCLCHDRRVSIATFNILEQYNLFTSQETIFILSEGFLNVLHNTEMDEEQREFTYSHLITMQGFILEILSFKLFIQTQRSAESRAYTSVSQDAVNQLINILFSNDPVLGVESDSPLWLDRVSQFDNQEQKRALMLELLDNLLVGLINKPAFHRKSEVVSLHSAISKALKGWQSALEIFLSRPADIIFTDSEADEQQFMEQLLFNITSTVLSKLSSILSLDPTDDMLSIQHSLTQLVSRLMSKLKDNQIQLGANNNDTPRMGPYRLSSIDHCVSLLERLVRCLVQNPIHSLTTRGTLYAALLDYLYFSRHRFVNMYEQQLIMDNENEQILAKTQTHLISCVCKDIVSCGDNAWKGVALATLDSLFSRMSNTSPHSIKAQWIEYISNCGLLRQLIDELSAFQAQLSTLLVVDSNFGTASEQERINKLYIHESIMSLLLKISQVDPNVLTRYNIIGMITNSFQFLDADIPQIDFSEHMDEEQQDLSALNNKLLFERHHQLCMPTLKFVVGLILQMHSSRVYQEQGLLFVQKHYKMLKNILKRATADPGDNSFSTLILEQASLVTSLLYLLAGNSKQKGVLVKAEKSMLQLLSKYANNEKAWHVESTLPHDLIRDVCKNILAYFRVATQHPQSDSIALRVIVNPSISDHNSMGTLLSLLEHTMNCSFELTKSIQESYERSTHSNQIIMGYAVSSAALERIVATRLQPYRYVVENTVLLLLRHLSFFLDPVSSPVVDQTKLRLEMTNRMNLVVQNMNKLDMYHSDLLRSLVPRISNRLKPQASPVQ